VANEIICYKCGIAFSVPTHWYNKRQESSATFWCPNGHDQAFVVSTAERLRREKDQLERSMQAQLNEANHARIVAEKTRDKAVRDKRKVERRIAHGVCPCCNQTFADLTQHMITNHKDYRLPEGKRPAQIEAGKDIQ
jgi:hypothetical protein